MSRIFHARATQAFAGLPMTVQLLLPDTGQPLCPVSLSYSTGRGTATLRMLPTDGVSAEESFVVYSATIPGEDVTGSELIYSFDCKQSRGEIYTVPIGALPALPPFVITEFATTMPEDASYYEICNPGTQTVDLYDYEILRVREGEPVLRNPLSDAPGVNLLAPGEVAVFHFLCAERLCLYGDAAADIAAMYATLAAQFGAQCEELASHPPRTLCATLADKTEDGFFTREGTFAPCCREPHRLLVVPRGEDAKSAVFELCVNGDGRRRNTPWRASALCTIDFSDPSKGIFFDTRRPATPGFVDVGQVLPYVGDTAVPSILPIAQASCVSLTGGSLPIRFLLIGDTVGMATVCVKTSSGVHRLAARPDDTGVWEASVPQSLLLGTPDRLVYWIEARAPLYTASLGEEKKPLTMRVIDNAGPVITKIYPADGQAIEDTHSPTIRLCFHDVSGVNLRTSTLFLDGVSVSDGAVWEKDGVTYRPAKPLSRGEHVLEVTLRDMLGNRTYRRVAFLLTDARDLHFYRGEIHSHTQESDGQGSPEEAMAYARDVGKADFFAVTEHCSYIDKADLDRRREVADRFNQNGRFAALFGYEVSWGDNGCWGHMNVLNTDWLAGGADHSLYDVYDLLERDEDAIAMFNHPGDKWGTFDSFAGFTPARDARVCLFEIKGAQFDRAYALALSRGWHASPVSGEDNHEKNWTTKTERAGVVLARSLTRENVLDAFRRGRTYATLDQSMRVSYRVNGHWLGARLQQPKRLSVEIDVTTERDAGIGELALVSEDNIVVARATAGARKHFSWRVELDPDFAYYYLRITNGNVYTVTSPVYVEGNDELRITDMRVVDSEDVHAPHAVSVSICNAGKATVSEVFLECYVTSPDGFVLREQIPFVSVAQKPLKAGETRTVCVHLPDVRGARRMSAVLYGKVGKRRLAATRYLCVTPVIISKVCSCTSPEAGEENPFAFVQLYNHTCVPFALDGYYLNARHTRGNALPEHRVITPLDGYEIPAHGTLTVWVRRAGSALTVQDFNARYGTSLTQGKDLLITDQPILTPKTTGHLLTLCTGEERLACVAFGRYCNAPVPEQDEVLYYRYAHDMDIMEQPFRQSTPCSFTRACREQRMESVPAAGGGGVTTGDEPAILTRLRGLSPTAPALRIGARVRRLLRARRER